MLPYYLVCQSHNPLCRSEHVTWPKRRSVLDHMPSFRAAMLRPQQITEASKVQHHGREKCIQISWVLRALGVHFLRMRFGHVARVVGSDLFITDKTTRLGCGTLSACGSLLSSMHNRMEGTVIRIVKANDVILVRSGSIQYEKKKKSEGVGGLDYFWMCLCCGTTVWIFIW